MLAGMTPEDIAQTRHQVVALKRRSFAFTQPLTGDGVNGG
jgi:hypothetical protein